MRIFSFFSVLLLGALLVSPVLLFAPEEPEVMIKGRVRDADTGEPLAFVHIVINDSRHGGMTDIDGFFELSLPEPSARLQFSHVGYEDKVYHPADAGVGPHEILLRRKAVELREVVVSPGENPAHRIIEKVMARRERNNPENTSSFTYKSYNKFVFTGAFDQDQRPGPAAMDSAGSRISSYLEERHFFLMETITERKFRYPDRSNETILASRISGMEQPLFAILVSQMQSFSFYDDYIHITDNHYLSPLAPGSITRYFFNLEDSVYSDTDTVYVISYRPERERNFNGLEGVMNISSRGWALKSVIAAPAGQQSNTRIRIQQNYALVDGRQWFPVQLNTDLELLNLEGLQDFRVIGEGRTYLSEITIDPPLGRRDFSPYHVEFSDGTNVDDTAFWDSYRRDSLSARDSNTYHYLDSIGRERNLDGQIERLQTLFNGSLRWGSLDFPLADFLGYNSPEGFRPGFSASTNNRFSQKIRLNGKLAYGFRDQRLKYGAGGNVLIDRLRDFRLGYDYSYDVQERGGSNFLQTGGLFSPQDLRSYYLETLDMNEKHLFWVQFLAARNFLTVKPFLGMEEVRYSDDYRFESLSDPNDDWQGKSRYFEAGVQLRLAYGEQFILTPRQIMRFSDNIPVWKLNVSRGIKGVLLGEYDYWRIEAKFKRTFQVRMLGTQQWTIRAGYFSGEAPLDKHFIAPAAYSRFAITTPEAFSTMRMDEFVSDRYVAVFWYHNFGHLLYRGGSFNPQFVLKTNAGIGSIGRSAAHKEVDVRAMNKGFLESGIAILDLVGSGFSSVGLEFMMRYGPHARPRFSDNYSIRLSYNFLFQ